jgi:hypothetical protein
VTKTIPVAHFWRIARRASATDVRAGSQGNGRFDDPRGLVGAVYGARELRTCLYDLLEPWSAGAGAAAVFGDSSAESGSPQELDAEADRALARASRTRSVPKFVYERDAVIVVPHDDIELLDLERASVRERLVTNPDVAAAMRSSGLPKLDRAALLSPAASPWLTQAIAGAVMHGSSAFGRRSGGICAPTHRGEDVFVVFTGAQYEPKLRVVLREPLNPNHRLLREVASELGLTP